MAVKLEKLSVNQLCKSVANLTHECAELQRQLGESLAAEQVWETTMMQVCGEDGPASVAAEITALRNLRDTALVSLRSENDELQRKLAIAMEMADNSLHVLRLETNRNQALAADNSRLNDVAKGGAFVMQKALMKYEFGVGMTEQAEHFIRDANEEFKATDAALAEVRAQGVEAFAKFCGAENSVFIEAKAYYRSLPDAAYEFVQQLRKEAGL